MSWRGTSSTSTSTTPTRDKSAYNGGLFWHTYHYGDADTATHRTYPRVGQGPHARRRAVGDHNYTTGLMLHYFLTGDAASRETVDRARRNSCIDMDDGRQTVFQLARPRRHRAGHVSVGGRTTIGPGRGPANSLNALSTRTA